MTGRPAWSYPILHPNISIPRAIFLPRFLSPTLPVPLHRPSAALPLPLLRGKSGAPNAQPYVTSAMIYVFCRPGAESPRPTAPCAVAPRARARACNRHTYLHRGLSSPHPHPHPTPYPTAPCPLPVHAREYVRGRVSIKPPLIFSLHIALASTYAVSPRSPARFHGEIEIRRDLTYSKRISRFPFFFRSCDPRWSTTDQATAD